MTLPVTFNEFKKNPIAAVTFCMLVVVGYLYYDSESTKKNLIEQCQQENKALLNKVDNMQLNIKRNDSLLAVYSYEIKFYLNAIEGYSQTIQK